jgi:hypothetical protein
MINMRVLFSAAVGSSLLGVPLSKADGLFPTMPQMIEQHWESHAILGSRLLSSAPLDHSDRHKALRQYLDHRGVHPLLQLVEEPSDQEVSPFGLSEFQGPLLRSRSYALRVGAYEVCNVSVRTVETPRGEIRAVGVVPNVDSVFAFTDDAWPSKEEALTLAHEQLSRQGVRVASSQLRFASRCLYPKNHEFIPAWKLVVRSGYYPYQLFVSDAEVLEGDLLAFDVTAKVRAYQSNPTDVQLKDFDVTVNGSGYMANDYFVTQSADAAKPRQFSSTNLFQANQFSAYFAEQSSFLHVNRHFDYASSMGYIWKGPKPLTVKNHVVFSNGDINNAVYTPFDGQTGPFILIANGDGIGFQGLALDSDVVSHEFGHHIIFGSLKATTGESLVIHEGLADAIAFVRSGDACLGESICPMKSNPLESKCQVNGECLRSGATTMKYRDSAYNASQAHFKGQVVSGLFWDMYSSGKISAADMGRLVIGAAAFLPSKADMAALLLAVLDADQALFPLPSGKGKYRDTILAAADGRGLGAETLGLNLDSVDGVAPDTQEEGAQKSKSGGKGFLGLCSVGTSTLSIGSSALVVFLLMVPLVIQFVTARRRFLPVEIRKKP